MTRDELIALIKHAQATGESLAHLTFMKAHPGARYAIQQFFDDSWLNAKEAAGLTVTRYKKYAVKEKLAADEAEYVDPYRPEEVKLRPCLRCSDDKPFVSRWAGDRFCSKHRNNNGDHAQWGTVDIQEEWAKVG